MASTVPHLGELIFTLEAPPAWRTVDFISDLHLDAACPETVTLFEQYLSTSPAEAIIILGDLFEVWIGDDCLDEKNSFESQCADALRQCAQRRSLYFMHGNRDFLVGEKFAQATQVGMLSDPCVLRFSEQNWLLSHGDALCLADTDYQVFRKEVRSSTWQAAFQLKSLAERRTIARSIRATSESRKRSGQTYADVDAHLACEWLHLAQANTLIHGHTHLPAVHTLQSITGIYRRIVLSDWDGAATPARAQVLRLTSDGLTRINL